MPLHAELSRSGASNMRSVPRIVCAKTPTFAQWPPLVWMYVTPVSLRVGPRQPNSHAQRRKSGSIQRRKPDPIEHQRRRCLRPSVVAPFSPCPF